MNVALTRMTMKNQPLQFSDRAKQALLESGPLIERDPKERLAMKAAKAIKTMGATWVFHKKNNVRRLSEPLPEVFAWKPSKVLKGRK